MTSLRLIHSITTHLVSRWLRCLVVYRQAMSEISGHLNDERLERHIQFLTDRCLTAYKAGDRALARRYDAARMAALRCRSQSQVERMERQMGVR